MEKQSLLKKANKWLNGWKYDLSFINTRTLLDAFMDGFRQNYTEKILKQKSIDVKEYNKTYIKAYDKGIDWVTEFNKNYSGEFFTRECVISAYIVGLTINI